MKEYVERVTEKVYERIKLSLQLYIEKLNHKLKETQKTFDRLQQREK